MPGRRSLLTERIAVVTVKEAKNRAFAGRLQVRTVRDDGALSWLIWLLTVAEPDRPVWPASAKQFRLCMDLGLKYFGLERLKLTPASMRAGGATRLFEQGRSISDIRFAGSWASERVLTAYLQEAESAAALLDIGHSEAMRLEQLGREFSCAAQPPATPYGELVRQ